MPERCQSSFKHGSLRFAPAGMTCLSTKTQQALAAGERADLALHALALDRVAAMRCLVGFYRIAGIGLDEALAILPVEPGDDPAAVDAQAAIIGARNRRGGIFDSAGQRPSHGRATSKAYQQKPGGE